MSGNCTNADCAVIKSCTSTLQQYLAEMKKNGTKKLLWMIYPDAQGSSWATLKKNQDIWAQVVPPVMAACTDPKVLVVDLRPVWAGHYAQYTTDGIHCTAAGGTATAEAFWKATKENNFFDLETSIAQPYAVSNVAPSAILSKVVGNCNVAVSLSVDQPSNIMLRLTTVSGRSVLTAQRQTTVSGMQTLVFPFGGLARGIYFCEVKGEKLKSQSTLLVP